jgi:hypothetical protein
MGEPMCSLLNIIIKEGGIFMYIIAFESEADYKEVLEAIKGIVKPTLTTGDPWEAVARHEARAAVENKLINVPELYYEDDFNDNVIVDGIAEALSDSDLIDQFYQEASDEFDNQVKEILEDRNCEL